ncbi:MAG: DcaP family trimeric outer membrane transporter [Pseudomonadota bacterium]
MRVTLMCGAALFAPAAGYASDLEDRVADLERKLDLILQKLEGSAAPLSYSETAALRDAGAAIEAGKIENPNAPPATSGPGLPLQTVELDTPGGVSAQRTDPPKPKEGLGFEVGDTSVKFSGYVKLDTSLSRTTGGDLPTNSLGRDFYLPALVPVGGDGDGVDIDFNPRETRFTFDMKSARGGHDIGGRIEFDFQVTSDGNERVSNSFTPRMRQAYLTVDNWLFGQAWSTFQDVAALPDNLDFIGPAESTVFERQPMIRYTRGGWQFAIEQPETTIADLANGGARMLPGDDFAPDFVGRYNHKRDWGHVTAAVIGRALHVEEGMGGSVEDTAVGYGASISGKIKTFDKDDFRFMVTAGNGIGRYIGLNLDNDAVIDAEGRLDLIPTYTFFTSYRHFWTPNWRSNFTYGFFRADTPEFQGEGVGLTDAAQSVHVNLIHTPIRKLDIGVEYIFADRETDNELDGQLHRLQFSSKYSF